MRITNNLPAVNTHRQYLMNIDRVQSSAEKLSSGFRINRAGDDAAGLAISEKMRSQIRGLGMAARNVKDAVSLIQTAEGALTEVHSMLQRMNELAVQSATGTNEAFDRTQLSKEFEQLKREINDISAQTTFNNMNLLDGSLSSKGRLRAAYSSGIYTSFETNPPVSFTGGIQNISLAGGSPFAPGTPAVFSLGMQDVKLTADIPAYTTVFTIGGEDVLIQRPATRGMSPADFASLFNNSTLDIDGESFEITASGASLTFKSMVNGSTKAVDINGLEINSMFVTGLKSNVAGAQEGTPDTLATIAQAAFTFDHGLAKSGDKFSIGTVEYAFWDSEKDILTEEEKAALSSDTHAVDLSKVTSSVALIDFINAAQQTPVSEKSIVASLGNNGKILITYNGNAGSSDEKTNNRGFGKYGVPGNKHVQITSAPKSSEGLGTTVFEIDTAKLRAGDKLSYEDSYGVTRTWEFKKGNSVKDIASALGIGEDALSGNSWSVTGKQDQSYRLGFEAAPDFKQYDEMKIQVGALYGEQLSIKIAAMNTTGLKLDAQGIYTQQAAGKAVSAVRSAVNQVSDQRALLGAMQNRLTHKKANINTSVENLQASESRIRDIDIASEMTTFTKNNILSQAATSMLAQANNAPQNVLSLLR